MIGGYISEDEFQLVTAGRDYLLRFEWFTDDGRGWTLFCATGRLKSPPNLVSRETESERRWTR